MKRQKEFAAVLMAAASLTGCATSPTRNEIRNVDYRQLADCSYLKLSPITGPGLTKADNPTQGVSRLSLESGGVLYWELLIFSAGKAQSRVEFKPGRNMWGSDSGGASDVWPVIQSCS